MDVLLLKAAWEEKMGIIIGICDNEDEWRNIILERIMEYASGCQQKIEYRMYASVEEYLQAERHADILLLETEMIGMSGIELKDWLDKTGSREAILFISSQKEQMREAFGRNVYGFLEKPIQKDQLFSCLDKIVAVRGDCTQIRIGNDKCIPADKIMYVKSIDKYVEIHTIDSIEVGYFSMKECQKILAEVGFRRVQKSYLIHFRYVIKIGAEIVMQDGTMIRPMRGTVKTLKEEYSDYVLRRIGKQN